jgi:hypothetical protein
LALRFANIPVPQGARISSARVTFAVSVPSTVATDVVVTGELSPSAAAFEQIAYNLSSRQQTAESVSWDAIDPWTAQGALMPTPDLAPIVEELVGQATWVEGNAVAFFFTGQGNRVAWSFDGEAASAPRLDLSWELL